MENKNTNPIETITPETVVESTEEELCSNCGEALAEGHIYCPKCGQKVFTAEEECAVSTITPIILQTEKKGFGKKKIAILGASVIAVIVIVFNLSPNVESIELSNLFIDLQPGESTNVTYTILPEESSSAKVSWSTTDESVATVDKNGMLTAVGEGVCKLNVSAGGKTDHLTVTVKHGPDFNEIYLKYCDSSYAEVGDDGSYLSIDTNPLNIDRFTESGSMQAIKDVNNAIGLPSYVYDDMVSTNALMGRQTEDFDDIGITVSWSYHPDNGLEVSYKLK